MTWLTKQPIPWLQKLGKRLAAYKVHVARRVAKQANPSIRYDAVVGNIVDEAIAVSCSSLGRNSPATKFPS